MSLFKNIFSAGANAASKSELERAQDEILMLRNERQVLLSKYTVLENGLQALTKEKEQLEDRLKDLLAGNAGAASAAANEKTNQDLQQLQAKFDTLQAKTKALEIVLEQERSNKGAEAPKPATQPVPPAANTAAQPQAEEAQKHIAEMEEHVMHTAKLATLGQLVAGIAHEINTPIGAINAASTNLLKGVPLLLQNLPQTLSEVDAQTRDAFFKLVDRGMSFKETLSSRDERNYRKQVVEQLESKGISNAAVIASGLVKMGVFEKLDEYLLIFSHAKADQLVELASAAGKVKVNVDNINIAITKAMRINQGLKNFSHKSDPDKPELTDIKESIETVLTVYHNVLKYNVETTKHYDENLPKTLALPDELSQVWANLIQNAAQAMNAAGKLDISARMVNDKTIRVDITDSGPGIPPDIQEKIWQPFFTTKKKGEGTGLGLDIVKRIITNHHGTITVKSQPGETTFTVRLPVRSVTDAMEATKA
jgi:signal transduction histidine kinase